LKGAEVGGLKRAAGQANSRGNGNGNVNGQGSCSDERSTKCLLQNKAAIVSEKQQ